MLLNTNQDIDDEMHLWFHSGNTPVTVTGTNLDIIQNPLIRAKYKNMETVNVSASVFLALNELFG